MVVEVGVGVGVGYPPKPLPWRIWEPQTGRANPPMFCLRGYTLAELRPCGGDGAGTITATEPLEHFISPR